MVACKKKQDALNVLAWEMANNPETNPEGLPKEVFMGKLKRQRFTPDLKAEYTKDKITMPKYGTPNSYSKPGYETLKAEYN